jgi:hypothetical protein
MTVYRRAEAGGAMPRWGVVAMKVGRRYLFYKGNGGGLRFVNFVDLKGRQSVGSKVLDGSVWTGSRRVGKGAMCR